MVTPTTLPPLPPRLPAASPGTGPGRRQGRRRCRCRLNTRPPKFTPRRLEQDSGRRPPEAPGPGRQDSADLGRDPDQQESDHAGARAAGPAFGRHAEGDADQGTATGPRAEADWKRRYATKLEEEKKGRVQWENRFRESMVERSLQDAAVTGDAFQPAQVVTISASDDSDSASHRREDRQGHRQVQGCRRFPGHRSHDRGSRSSPFTRPNPP